MKMKKLMTLLMALLLLCPALTSHATEVIDIDLTLLSSTLRTAEMMNMVLQPDSYVGKTVKLQGSYSVTYSESTNTPYHFAVVADAAACCQQGMEFIWAGEHAFPEEYPEIGATIEVIGVYGVYEKAGYLRYYIETESITLP